MDRGLRAIGTVRHGEQLTRCVARGQARQRAPSDQPVRALRGDRRIAGGTVGCAEQHDVGTRAALCAQIGLVGGDQQVAGGQGHDAFGADARRQQLRQPRRRQVADIVDADQRSPFRDDEDMRDAPKGRDLDRFRFDTLGVRALVGIVARPDDRVFEAAARVVDDRAVAVKDAPSARPALIVALVRGGEMVGVDPLDRIGFARNVRQRPVKGQRPVVARVDVVQADRAGAEMRGDGAVRADHDDMVVFLQGDDDLSRGVDVDIFRLGVVGGDVRQTGQVDAGLPVAVQRAVGDGQRDHMARGHLRQGAVVQVLVALVLDRDGQKAAVIGTGDRIRLPAQVAGCQHRAGLQVQHPQLPRGFGERGRRVHAHIHPVADDHGGGGFPVHRHGAQGQGSRRVGDVQKAQHPKRAVGIDQRVAVFGGRDDLGRGRARPVLSRGHVVGRGECRDPVECGLGHRRHGRGQRDGRRQKGKSLHRGIPRFGSGSSLITVGDGLATL